MINPITSDILNTEQNGHLNILASSSEKGDEYAFTRNRARCLDTAVLAGGSECLNSGIALVMNLVARRKIKVEHFNYAPHPVEFFPKKITSLYKIASHEPNGFQWGGISERIGSAQQYDLITIVNQRLPNLTNQIGHGYASEANQTPITKLYQIIDTLIQKVRSLPIFTKHYQAKPIDFMWFYAIMNYIKNKGGTIEKIH